ncbi:hypothetical protein QUA79_20375 [Microcoleus sp. F8-D1]
MSSILWSPKINCFHIKSGNIGINIAHSFRDGTAVSLQLTVLCHFGREYSGMVRCSLIVVNNQNSGGDAPYFN